jgi:hypothetical protein
MSFRSAQHSEWTAGAAAAAAAVPASTSAAVLPVVGLTAAALQRTVHSSRLRCVWCLECQPVLLSLTRYLSQAPGTASEGFSVLRETLGVPLCVLTLILHAACVCVCVCLCNPGLIKRLDPTLSAFDATLSAA